MLSILYIHNKMIYPQNKNSRTFKSIPPWLSHFYYYIEGQKNTDKFYWGIVFHPQPLLLGLPTVYKLTRSNEIVTRADPLLNEKMLYCGDTGGQFRHHDIECFGQFLQATVGSTGLARRCQTARFSRWRPMPWISARMLLLYGHRATSRVSSSSFPTLPAGGSGP